MNREERLRRDFAIASEALSGRSQKDIALRFQLSPRTVRRAIGRIRNLESGHGSDPFDQLRRRLAQLEIAIEDLAVSRLEARNPRTRIAAIRAQTAVMTDHMGMLMKLVGLAQAPPEIGRTHRIRREQPSSGESGQG